MIGYLGSRAQGPGFWGAVSQGGCSRDPCTFCGHLGSHAYFFRVRRHLPVCTVYTYNVVLFLDYALWGAVLELVNLFWGAVRAWRAGEPCARVRARAIAETAAVSGAVAETAAKRWVLPQEAEATGAAAA